MDRLPEGLRILWDDPETAVSERVAPLLYHASPREAPRPLRKAYYESAARNVALLGALEEMLPLLGERGVRPVVLKGADLGTSLYPNIAVRPMSDVDLWVTPSEVGPAEEVLRSLGLRPGCPEMSKGLVRSTKHARLYIRGPRDSVAVDLHWSLVGHDEDRRAPNLPWFRRHTSPSECGRFLVFDPTAALLYLAAHMKLQHYDERVPLLWLVDFHLAALRPGVDWRELSEAARTFGWDAAIAATASEVEKRLRVTLPPPLMLIRSGEGPDSPQPLRRKGGAERGWNELSTLSWAGRVALVKAYLFPSPTYLRWRYRPRPTWTWPLYYPLRWLRFATAAPRVLLLTRRVRPAMDEGA